MEKEFRAAAYNAFYATKLERDKHLFSISSAGLGFLITLATTIGFSDIYAITVFFLAIVSFLVCICAVLYIFTANADHLVSVMEGSSESSKLLSRLDFTALLSFVLGMIFSVFIGLFPVIDALYK
ncbi:hypothetical protein KFZ68_07015 [Photobacterium damselae]|uniref:hypothetical protein n=1 Tax=Photobacterium damselae TaxID=38293 RepID=UPI00254273ED